MEAVRSALGEIRHQLDAIDVDSDEAEADLRFICMQHKRILLFLVRQLQAAPHIHTLHLHRCSIDVSGAKILSRFLKRNTTIQSVSLAGNEVGDAGTIALGKALVQNGSLQYLSLRENQLGDAACRALGKALRRNGRLKSLSLEQNANISNAGIQALGQGILQNTTIETLALNDIGVGDAGVEMLANVLRVSPSLCTILLGRNDNIGTIGARHLAAAVQDCLESNNPHCIQCISLPLACRDTVASFPRAVRRIVSFDQ